MRKIIAIIFALTFLSSNSFADITFWTTEVQPARMEKQMEMAKSFESKTGIKVEVIPVEEKDLGSRATAAAAAGNLPDVIYHTLQYVLPWGEAGILDVNANNDVIKSLGKKVGLSLNPDTPIDKIEKYLDQIDLVLVMTVYPGFGGQKFISKVLNKIKNLKNIKDENKFRFDIEVDGGVNFENNKLAIEAGANILVSGTTIFKNNDGDIKKNIDLLRT